LASLPLLGKSICAILLRHNVDPHRVRLEWDAAAMRAKNAPEAEALIRKAYRKGFELMGGRS
jgi:hypothetical protein